ncbi:hypothetical protein [Peptostreptococcus porci]|uniref:hypothetical protein n=1 Tax=Peptostreptococcus porci TaxID=2652282 RepID=UPI002A80B8A1|nr:hypothetical protein [Peptostreptococcus porci]MDY4127601.1 hypothetical protein [Peptostreptococcus porci]
MKSIDVYKKNNKLVVYKDDAKQGIFSKKEFMEFIKNEDIKDIDFYSLIGNGIDNMMIMYKKFGLLNQEYHRMEKINLVNHSNLELLKHLDDCFDVNDEYFYICNGVIYSIDESHLYDRFIADYSSEKLDNMIENDTENTLNVIFDVYGIV